MYVGNVKGRGEWSAHIRQRVSDDRWRVALKVRVFKKTSKVLKNKVGSVGFYESPRDKDPFIQQIVEKMGIKLVEFGVRILPENHSMKVVSDRLKQHEF